MPTNFTCSDEDVLSSDDVARLWEKTVSHREHQDDVVNIKCVSAEEIRTLNVQYRNKDKTTNVLTFSYPSDDPSSTEHDIAVCMEVATKEAEERGVGLRDYVALLLVHAFLHATGMDHERSEAEADETRNVETAILQAAGFTPISL